MKIIKKILKGLLYFILLIVGYFLISLLLTYITINKSQNTDEQSKMIYIHSNGVHLDIAISKENISKNLAEGLMDDSTIGYYSFGWGDENFYINTPTWNDLTFGNAFSALFLKSSTLMHVTQYKNKYSDWAEVKVTEEQLNKINTYILSSFSINKRNSKIKLEGEGYHSNDAFYKAKGSYSCLHTCNSWVNAGFKESGLKSCLWTPFDFGLLNKHE